MTKSVEIVPDTRTGQASFARRGRRLREVRFGSHYIKFKHEYSFLEPKFNVATVSRIERHLVCDYDVVLKSYHETEENKVCSSYVRHFACRMTMLLYQ